MRNRSKTFLSKQPGPPQAPDNSVGVSLPVMAPGLLDEDVVNVENVSRKATRGAAALAVRQVLVYGSNIGGSIVLARLLPAAEFGYYSIVIFAVNFLNIFGGTGFASNLIRTPHEPTLEEKRAVFTSQELIVSLIFSAVWMIAPRLGGWYHLDMRGSLFFRLMGLGLLLTSFMVIPQVQMERKLDFDKLAMIEVCQAVVFNVFAILLALKGLGYISFAAALVLRTGTGAVMALVLSPWRAGLRLRSSGIAEHLYFGFALQAGQLLAVARDSLTPVFVSLYLGPADVGFITWAGFVAGASVLIIVPLQRLYLPMFAQVQGNKTELARFAGRVMWAVNTVCAPLTLMTLALLHPIVTVVFGAKWLSAIPLVYLFAVGNIFLPTVTVLLSVLNARGQARMSLLFTAMSMLFVWGVGVPMIMKYGTIGFAYTSAATHLLNFAVYLYVRKDIGLNPIPSFWPNWPLATLTGAALYAVRRVHPPAHLVALVAYGVIGIALYGAMMWMTSSARIRAFLELAKASRKGTPA